MFKYGSVQSKTVSGPEIWIKVFSSNRDEVKVRAIVDTGSPITCIPEQVFEKIKKDDLIYDVKSVRGAIGKMERKKIYSLNLSIARCKFNGIFCLAVNKGYAIIGRDIINKYKVTLDGKNMKWEVRK